MIVLDLDRLDSLLASKGLTTTRLLAARTGVPLATLRQIRRQVLPPLETRRRIAGALGVDESYLWRRVPRVLLDALDATGAR